MGIWKNAQMSIPAEPQSQCGDFVLYLLKLFEIFTRLAAGKAE